MYKACTTGQIGTKALGPEPSSTPLAHNFTIIIYHPILWPMAGVRISESSFWLHKHGSPFYPLEDLRGSIFGDSVSGNDRLRVRSSKWPPGRRRQSMKMAKGPAARLNVSVTGWDICKSFEGFKKTFGRHSETLPEKINIVRGTKQCLPCQKRWCGTIYSWHLGTQKSLINTKLGNPQPMGTSGLQGPL